MKINKMAKGNNYAFLIRQMAVTDFKLRYNSSILGYVWSLLNPLLMFTVLYIVFSIFMRFEGVVHYQLYLLLGIILWNYFSEATTNGMISLQYKSSLISKINFPKWIILAASNVTVLLSLLLNMLVLAVFFIINEASPKPTMPLFLFFLAQIIVLSYAVSLILSSFFLRFRDLTHFWGVMLQVGFWMTPIIYPLTLVPERMKQLLLINPMARLITDSRDVLIYGTVPPLRHNIITLALVVSLLAVGLYLFNRRSKKFAEEL